MFEFFDIIFYSILILISAMGLLIIFNDWKSINNRIFFLVVLGSIGWITSLHESWAYVDMKNWAEALFWVRLSYGFSILGTFLMTIFIYYFLKPVIKLATNIKILHIALNTLLLFLSAQTELIGKSLVIENQMYVTDNFGSFYPFYVFTILLNLFVSAYFSIKKFNDSIGINKKKMALVMTAYLTLFVLAILTNVIFPIFNIFIFQRASQFLIVVFIIPTFYAIYKYRFFNFSNAFLNLIRKIIIYSLYLIVVTVSYILLNNILNPGIIRGVISALIGVTALRLAENEIPRFETASVKYLKNTLTRFKSKVYYSNSYSELEKLIEELFLIELNFVNAKIFVVRKNIDDVDLNVYKENEFSLIISKKYKRDLIIKDEIIFQKINENVKKVLNDEMTRMNADLCLPLFSEKNLIGFFILKQKDSNNSYSNETLNELLSIKKDLEIGLMNILLKLNLKEENNLMKSIIDEKTRELKNKIEEINELVQQQSDFISVTAHEFRTPLSIASFQMEDILDSKDHGKNFTKELEIVNSSLSDLKQLTEKLFAIQQYDLNKVALNLEKIELSKFLKKIHKEFLPIMSEKKLKFELKIEERKGVFAKIDSLQIRQVLHNLLKNASKFTPERGKIVLGLKKEDDQAIIYVKDDGEGIPDKLKKAIFEKFRTKTSGAGIGLGLYLCKKTIELHQGKIWVEDVSKGGASFKIKLKLAKN